jgi:hypothetical protein
MAAARLVSQRLKIRRRSLSASLLGKVRISSGLSGPRPGSEIREEKNPGPSCVDAALAFAFACLHAARIIALQQNPPQKRPKRVASGLSSSASSVSRVVAGFVA